MARVKITLEQYANPDYAGQAGVPPHVYLVRKAVNTVTPHVGERLTRAEVAALCEREDYEVTIQ